MLTQLSNSGSELIVRFYFLVACVRSRNSLSNSNFACRFLFTCLVSASRLSLYSYVCLFWASCNLVSQEYFKLGCCLIKRHASCYNLWKQLFLQEKRSSTVIWHWQSWLHCRTLGYYSADSVGCLLLLHLERNSLDWQGTGTALCAHNGVLSVKTITEYTRPNNRATFHLLYHRSQVRIIWKVIAIKMAG